MDLFSERHEVRETARKNLYTGKTYNSVENIRQFFTERGAPQPAASAAVPAKLQRLPLLPVFRRPAATSSGEEEDWAGLDGGARQLRPRNGGAPGRLRRRHQVDGEFSRIRDEEIDREIRRNQDRMNTKQVKDKTERKKLKRAARKKAAPAAKRASDVARGSMKRKVKKMVKGQRKR